MFRWVTDVERGGWVADRLGPFGGWVGSVVPRGFDAYARVLHRARGRGNEPVRWVEVAASVGTVVHPTAQWWKVARRPDMGRHQGGWPGADPVPGELDPGQLAALVAVLRGFTGPDAVTAAFWEGSGWQTSVLLTARHDGDAGVPLGMRLRRSGTGVGARLRRRGAARTSRGPAVLGDPTPDPDVLVGPMLDPGVLGGPMLELPGRHHMLFAGSLDDVGALAEGAARADVRPFRPGTRTPSLLWPDDRSWCVATEVDLDSTLVGGPRRLIDTVLADETLEALEVSESDSLMVDGDQVNP
ncbi:MAG: hypothetical protein BGO37_17060 [Cellulomonas sp. 73-92]|uniref:hypothetical protein n=1 Tax=Cellulomonas sp. 73-92 TaxID=1895740 RepID=UPI000925CCE6|nr:hypothetical protein [Cellulomonas sp. 73-92]OJV81174.1 MAG: hypothetical protein BGO37_17060 [Cellulomonas sp. 73-92]